MQLSKTQVGQVKKLAADYGFAQQEERHWPDPEPIELEINKKSEPIWPETLGQEAFYGLAGDIVKTIEPHTEADPAALLFSFHGMFGNIVGRNAYYVVEADKHYTNSFTVLVGDTAKARKGVSYGQTKRLFCTTDETWTVSHGLSSGEGLIWAVRDEQCGLKKNKKSKEVEEVLIDPGVKDKRLMVVEQEFASVIQVMKRKGSTLSTVIRQAWDSGDLNTLVKNNPAKATGAHISMIAHISKEELLRHMDSTEAANGFGNRYLWVCVRRSKCLPEGGKLYQVDFAGILKRLDAAVEFGKTAGELSRDPTAKELWAAVYPSLSEGKPGMFGGMIARAEAQVLRLSESYALLDLSSTVRVEHLKAALSCWDFAERSAKFIFGDKLGDPLADEILSGLKYARAEGMTRTGIYQYLGCNIKTEEIGRSLNLLVKHNLAACAKKTNETTGRQIEVWFSKNNYL